MDGMEDIASGHDAPTGPTASSGRAAMLERLARIRRPDDRMVAGVSTGIAREFDTDPVIIRIGFVVLLLFGLAGAVLYLTCWALLPRDGVTRSPIGRLIGLGDGGDHQLRGYGLAAVVALAALSTLTGWGFGHRGSVAWLAALLATVALPVAIVVQAIRGRADPARTVPDVPRTDTARMDPVRMDTTTASAGSPTAPSGTREYAAPGGGTGGPPRPPRPRWSPALLVVTLSAVLVAQGSLWFAALVLGADIAPSVYPATALALITIGLFAGTRIGNGGWLVPLGMIAAVVLCVTTVLPGVDAGNRQLTPTTAAGATTPITLGVGEVDVDLTQVADTANLRGQTLHIRLGVGQTVVTVPQDLPVSVVATVRVGNVQVFDRSAANQRVTVGSDETDALRIQITQNIGDIEVERS